MALFDWTFYGITLGVWALALLLAGVILAALKIANGIAIRQLSAIAERTHNEIDDLAADVLRHTRMLPLLLVALYLAARILDLPPRADELLGRITIIGILLQGAVWGNAAIRFVLARYSERQLEADASAVTTVRFLGFISRLALWTIVVLLVLDNLNVEITALVAGLGVGGIAVALATQNVLSDLFGSLSIVLDKPFVIGDFIIVGDMMGSVEHIGLKTTRVRSLSGEQLVFSNADLLGSRIRNYKRMYERRVVFGLGVVYETDHATLAGIPGLIREVVEAQEHARFDRAHFKAFGAFSLDFEIVYYVTVADYNVYMDIQQAINLEIFRRFEERGIGFAYPTQKLYVQPEGGGAPARG